MQRILLAIGGAAAFCAAVTFLLQIAISRGLPATDIVLVTSSATLLLSVGAAVLAYRALNRSTMVAAELERLTRSMDAAIRDVSLRGDRDAARIEELSASVSGKGAAPQPRRKSDAGDQLANGDSEIQPEPHHGASPRKNRQTPAGASDDPEEAAVDTALRRMIAGGQADLSLQPIIAPGRGEAGGFEVYFHIQLEDGKPVNLRRLERQVADVHQASCERLAVVSAAEAARRGLGDATETRPLHVAISSALLDDGLEFSTVLDIFKLHPALARSIVMSLPAGVLETGGHSAALELLSGLDVRLAAEGSPASGTALGQLKEAGAAMVKVDADRLLDRTKTRKGAPSGAALVEMAAKAAVDLIATDVRSEEDAVSLIEMGIDLMTGERLSAPRPLEAETTGKRR